MTKPMTDGQLFDYCHEHFGWGGDYDDVANRSTPWFRVRSTEIGKIKSSRRRKKVEVEQLYATAQWCVAQGIHIRSVQGLNIYLFEAEQEARERSLADTRRRRDQLINDAIDREAERADGESARWIEILVRASGPERREVLAEWTRLRA